MALIISNTFLNTPPLSPLFRTVTHNHHNTRLSYHNLNRYTRLFTIKASSNAKESDYEGIEESRWLREEQRWLREEQRWLREESRWNSERNSLLLQIQRLQSELDRIQARINCVNVDVDCVVDDDSLVSRTLDKTVDLLKGLKSGDDSKRIPEVFDKEVVSEVVAPPVRPPESRSDEKVEKKVEEKEKTKAKVKPKASSSLRMGAEGDEVRILQEALMSLGFYSGEEDMEYSSFSEGTSRAVKTWQASIGVREDGVMTAELLERLYGSQELQSSELSFEADIRKIANGAVTEVREVRETVVKKEPTDVYVSEHRVFLLGENRWEEPSRLNKTKGNTQISAGKCLTCKGEGRLLCMECDGTGEPNVEEQFLDWVEEGANCPYCEGLGYNVCDVCHGTLVL
ncbi:uncharacterized protein LOC141599349 isoform X2 [Silene latifolia]|uniref:uncharacterized protein LOC141599349 isoform X2 n=1 Tax=Silene latifolia TaxID=37657 RepID=UPI003D78A114